MIFLNEVYVGDIFIVKLGEKIFVDGKIIKGMIVIDEFMLIGEFIFVEKNVDDIVIGLMMNKNGIIIMIVIKVGGDIVLVNIIKVVEEV